MANASANPGDKIIITAERIAAEVRWRALYNPSTTANVTVNYTSGPDTYSEDLKPKQLLPVTCKVNSVSAETHGYVDSSANFS